MKKILLIDDDKYILNLLENYLQRNGFEVSVAFSGMSGIKQIDKTDFDLILSDYRLPDFDGFKILQHSKSKNPATPVIIMTAYAEIKMAVKLIKSGAFDYIAKPVLPEEILRLINTVFETRKDTEAFPPFMDNYITGRSKNFMEVLNHVKVVAPTDLAVLIEGETGSGKEFIARAIHNASTRNHKPFIGIDCGAMPKELANSELFGHVKGAFTGAISDKLGYFEQANGGTLFLDEVGNLPYENQIKLLRALQEKIISRVGDNKTIMVDVRIITASNEDLLPQVESNEFREDLYHRLNGFKIHIPSLRDRGEDIMEFADFFITKANIAFNKQVNKIDEEVKKLFLNYEWYGNIRELQNVINRAVLLTQTDSISLNVLPEEIRTANKNNYFENRTTLLFHDEPIQDLKEATHVTERELISDALIRTNYNKSKAAQILNIDRKTLYNKIKLYNITEVKN